MLVELILKAVRCSGRMRLLIKGRPMEGFGMGPGRLVFGVIIALGLVAAGNGISVAESDPYGYSIAGWPSPGASGYSFDTPYKTSEDGNWQVDGGGPRSESADPGSQTSGPGFMDRNQMRSYYNDQTGGNSGFFTPRGQRDYYNDQTGGNPGFLSPQGTRDYYNEQTGGNPGFFDRQGMRDYYDRVTGNGGNGNNACTDCGDDTGGGNPDSDGDGYSDDGSGTPIIVA